MTPFRRSALALTLPARRLLPVILLAALLALTACGGAPAATSWPGLTLSGDVAYVAYNQHVYAANLASQTKLWQFPNDAGSDTFYGDPAFYVDGNLVVVGSYSLGKVHGVGAADGAERWVYTPDWGDLIPGLDLVKRPNGNIIAGAGLEGQTAYVPINNGLLVAIDPATGAQRWVYKTENENGFWARPVYHDGVIYATSIGHLLYAIDAATGTLKWAYPAGAPLAGSVTVTGSTVLFGTFDNRVLAVDTGDNGTLRWEHPVDAWVWGAPQVFSNTVYAVTLGGTLYALNLDTGTVIWQRTIENAPPVRAPLLVTQDSVYAAAKDGRLYAFERATGNPRWTAEFFTMSGGPSPSKVYGQLLSQPQAWHDKIVVALMGSDLPLLQLRNAADGAEGWSFKP
jgi:outer membrane protein assembly factor BamB